MNKDESFKEELTNSEETVKNGVAEKSLTGATKSIDKWIKTLEDKKGFKTISENLTKLKEAIKAKDAENICSLMDKLGEQTIAKSELDGVEDGKNIKSLGKALVSGSRTLKKLTSKN